MHYKFKKNYIIFIIIAFITLNVHTSELNQDTILMALKDLTHEDMTNFARTSKYYDKTLNAAFYAKMLSSRIPTVLQHQLSIDEDFFITFHRIQTKRHLGLTGSDQGNFGLAQLFAVNSGFITQLINNRLLAKYERGDVHIPGYEFGFRLNKKVIKLKQSTFDEQVLFFSDPSQPTKHEIAINALPSLVKKIKAREIEKVKNLLQQHDQFDCIWHYYLIESLCALKDYKIIKNFVAHNRFLEKNYEEGLYRNVLTYVYATNSLPLFRKWLAKRVGDINCNETIAQTLKQCIDAVQIPWIQIIVQNCKINQEMLEIKFDDQGKMIDYGRETLLESVCKSTRDVIKLILPHCPQGSFETALEFACTRNDKSLVEWLLQKADVNRIYRYEKTLVQYIIEHIKTTEEIIVLLLQKADLLLVDRNKKNLLHSALEKGLNQVAQFLLDKIDVNSLDDKNQNSLHYALNQRPCSPATIELLLKKKVNVNQEDNDGIPPLSHAFSYPKDQVKQVIDLLIRSGANIHYTTQQGETALHNACKKGIPIDIIQTLIDSKLNPNAKNDLGETPLHKACCYRQLKAVRLLLENGADVNAQDNKGEISLCHCKPWHRESCCWDQSETNHQKMPLDIIELLLKRGANIIYSMEKAYDRLACICLLKEDEHTLASAEKLFCLIRSELKKHAIDVLVTLAQRNNNKKIIEILTKSRLATYIENIIKPKQRSTIATKIDQTQPKKISTLQKYRPYIFFASFTSVAILLYAAKKWWHDL